jgi:hypothetical protein
MSASGVLYDVHKLYERVLFQISYICVVHVYGNVQSTHKKSTILLFFVKLVNDQQNYVQISLIKFHPNWAVSEESG